MDAMISHPVESCTCMGCHIVPFHINHLKSAILQKEKSNLHQ